MEKKIERAFTRADVEAYFQANWGQRTGYRCELTDVRIVRGVTPPIWEVSYDIVRSEWDRMGWNSLIKQEEGIDGDPYLIAEIPVQLPAGFATPAEEDAELERLWKMKVEEYRKSQQTQ